MNKLVKYTLLTVVANLAFAALVLIPFFLSKGEEQTAYFFLWFFVHGIALLAQLIIAIVLIINQTKRVMGQGMLIGLGLLLLIGLAACGGLVFFSY